MKNETCKQCEEKDKRINELENLLKKMAKSADDAYRSRQEMSRLKLYDADIFSTIRDQFPFSPMTPAIRYPK